MTEIDRYAKVLHTLIKEEFTLVPIPAHFIMVKSFEKSYRNYRWLSYGHPNVEQSTKFYEKEKINVLKYHIRMWVLFCNLTIEL